MQRKFKKKYSTMNLNIASTNPNPSSLHLKNPEEYCSLQKVNIRMNGQDSEHLEVVERQIKMLLNLYE